MSVSNDATEADAIEAAREMPLTVNGERTVSRVDDIDSASAQVP